MAAAVSPEALGDGERRREVEHPAAEESDRGPLELLFQFRAAGDSARKAQLQSADPYAVVEIPSSEGHHFGGFALHRDT